ncbi:orotate phosphoribosyltransferase, partial [Patescibacteria group bacterium]|nr:orotate phosphoribosyltransferase [Patescibacteria group bacterium]
ISTGKSSLGSAQALKKECQANVLGIIAIYSHTLQVADSNFKKQGLDCRFLTDFETVVKTAVEKKYLNKNHQKNVLYWREQGAEWGKNMGFIKTI